MNRTQMAIPVDISQQELARKDSFQGALQLCAEAAGFHIAKQVLDAMGELDKSQLSGWYNGKAAPTWPKLNQFMDVCGNDAPLLWMLYQRGYDLSSLRKRETELEKKLREANEQIAALKRVLAIGSALH